MSYLNLYMTFALLLIKKIQLLNVVLRPAYDITYFCVLRAGSVRTAYVLTPLNTGYQRRRGWVHPSLNKVICNPKDNLHNKNGLDTCLSFQSFLNTEQSGHNRYFALHLCVLSTEMGHFQKPKG